MTRVVCRWLVRASGQEVGDPLPASARTPPAIAMRECGHPEYPELSIRFEQTGAARLRLTIAESREVIHAQIVRSSGYRMLDEAALKAVKTCRFPQSPGAASATAAPTRATKEVEYVWRLQGPSAWQRFAADQHAGGPPNDIQHVFIKGRSLAPRETQLAVLRAMQQATKERANCSNLVAASVALAPPHAARLAPPRPAKSRPDLHELWTVQQCGYRLDYLVTIRFDFGTAPTFGARLVDAQKLQEGEEL